MTFDTLEDFLDEWDEFPNDLNYLINYSPPDDEGLNCWVFEILQPRKLQVLEVIVNIANEKQVKQLAVKSLSIIRSNLIK